MVEASRNFSKRTHCEYQHTDSISLFPLNSFYLPKLSSEINANMDFESDQYEPCFFAYDTGKIETHFLNVKTHQADCHVIVAEYLCTL